MWIPPKHIMNRPGEDVAAQWTIETPAEGDTDTTGGRREHYLKSMWTPPEGDMDTTGGDLPLPQKDEEGAAGRRGRCQRGMIFGS